VKKHDHKRNEFILLHDGHYHNFLKKIIFPKNIIFDKNDDFLQRNIFAIYLEQFLIVKIHYF